MNPAIIFLSQSVTGAVITIIALLLVAAIIGYLTAWFYAKSVYTPIIKGLEAEKAGLQKQVADLKEELGKLNRKVEDLQLKINELEGLLAKKDKELTDLKARIKE
jgi:peptidoglycan hydrolase CwlO-like protein